jgi:hypothetical protein
LLTFLVRSQLCGAPIRFSASVRPCTWNNSRTAGRNFTKISRVI